MATIGKDGPSQGSANLQIEQIEEEQEQEEQEEETGQQVRSGKGSSITRPAMMGGDTDVELSTRRQKRCVCITSSTPFFQLYSRIFFRVCIFRVLSHMRACVCVH
jgi:hypothetical protein